jgi:hypothetical protein
MHSPLDEENKLLPDAYNNPLIQTQSTGYSQPSSQTSPDPGPSSETPPQIEYAEPAVTREEEIASIPIIGRRKREELKKRNALQAITIANPVGASVLMRSDQYYESVLHQAQRSFHWALFAAIIGLLFFLAAVAFLLLRQPQNISFVSLISGALVEAISALNFYLYGRASQQLINFHQPLERTQRFILANNICDMLHDSKEEIRAKLILTLINAPAASVNDRKKVDNKRDYQSQANKPYDTQEGGYQPGEYQQVPYYQPPQEKSSSNEEYG